MANYEIAHIDEIDVLDDGRCPFRPVRSHFGITSFGINTWTADAGQRLINEHDEADDGNEELYFVSSGRATFEIDGERREAPAGTFVFVRPDAKRTAFADEAGTTLVAIGAVPGKVYEPGGFELWIPFAPLYGEGRYAEAADGLRPVAEAHPEYPMLLYNLACCESLAGRVNDAIEHLRGSLARSDGARRYLENDSDLDPLRGEPSFQELL